MKHRIEEDFRMYASENEWKLINQFKVLKLASTCSNCFQTGRVQLDDSYSYRLVDCLTGNIYSNLLRRFLNINYPLNP